ncbi:transducin beta-like protein 3 [Cocos nucifera]|uniref:Transducin beta-like protein 3 n=1 Tax=Cocos nucifera TaxID=13894 RepID=A0A8K0MX97_COCNU|nr:transducin beta-like protein 3 [Cocos nucifera]
MAAPSPVSLKRNYRCVSSLQQFYSGGAFAVSSDGAFLACACGDQIKVVDTAASSVRATLEGDSEAVTALALSPDDRFLFSASHSRLIRVWDLSSLKCIRSWKGHDGPVMGIACHSSGGLIATAGADKRVCVWDVDGGFCTHFFKGHQGVVTSIAFHSDPNRLLLLSGSDDASIRVWNLESKKCVAVMEKHFSPVTSLALSEDGQTLLSAGRDKFYFSNSAVCIYEQQSSDATLSSHEEDSRRGFTSAVILPSDQGLLCVTAGQQFLFYSPINSVEGEFDLNLYKRLVGYNEEILDMRFLGEDEEYLAVATNLEQVRVYDVASMSCAYVLSGHTDIVVCVDTCISSSGRTLVVTGSKDNSVRVWDIESRHCIDSNSDSTIYQLFGPLNVVLVLQSDRTIKVWSMEDVAEDVDQEIVLKAKAVVAAHDKDINSLAVSPNDSLVCSGSEDHTACLWRLPDLVSVAVLKGHRRGIWSVEFSPVDQCVMTASGGDGLVKLWTLKSNECIATYDQHEGKVWALAVGRKTEMLATGGTDAIVNLWHDCTAADKQEAFHKEEEAILRGQELENAVSDADYTRAIQLAFELRRPHKLFELFSQLCRIGDTVDPIEKALSGLGKEELRVLLEYIKGVGELLEGLIPYSQRHFSRIDRLVRSTFLLDYILTKMSVIDPETGTLPTKPESVLLSENDLKVERGLPKMNDQTDNTYESGHNNQILVSEIEEKVASKKRKSSKSKRGSQKKVKVAPHDGGSVVSVEA